MECFAEFKFSNLFCSVPENGKAVVAGIYFALLFEEILSNLIKLLNAQVALSTGAVLSFVISIDSPDVEKLAVDKLLVGKMPSPVADGKDISTQLNPQGRKCDRKIFFTRSSCFWCYFLTKQSIESAEWKSDISLNLSNI